MKKVFIVEDEAIVVMELKDRLRTLGYSVCGHAARGEAALRQIPEVRPDLVLMDINLGSGMTGLDVAERLRAVIDVPVIFITAYSDAEITERAGQSGSFAYIVKPFDSRVLGANIELALARHDAQGKLRQSQERLELALRGADLGSWDWNIQTGEVVFNSRWAEMRGFTLQEVEPHVGSWLGGIHPDDLSRVQRVLTDYFEGKTPAYEVEHRASTRSGEWIWILDRGKVFERDAEGRPARMVGTELDITERKRTEELLHAAVEARENLLAVVSHDLRSPLSAIEMSAYHLAHVLPPGEQGASCKYVNVILRSAERMRRLIDDLLQAATIEAGRFTVELMREDVLPIVEEVLHSLESAATVRAVHLRHEVPEGLPPLLCDRMRMIQVLCNLVGNAIKFVSEGGNVQVRAWAQADDICFAVRDDGPGIAGEHVPHLFDRYWKGEGEGRRGVGLGLYITKGIVEAHGGRIWVETQVGAGSTFHFTIPLGRQV